MADNTSSTVDYDNEAQIALKLSLYLTLKNLYDKWFTTYSAERFQLLTPDEEDEERRHKITGGKWDNSKSEFSSFIYVDSFYSDIGNKMLLNPETMLSLIKDHREAKDNFSVYRVFYDMCANNRLLFITLPVYNNYYDETSLTEAFTPQPDRTMEMSDGATYVCMYTHMPSHSLNNTDDNEEKYRQDGFDIADVNGKISQETCNNLFKTDGNGDYDIKVPAFGVTYARQNQSFFSNIEINMENPTITDYSIQNQMRIAKMGTGQADSGSRTMEERAIAQDAYSVFSNQSYTCTVEMLGDMNIMPMMYFQLNNIPMFRGAYMITSVEHNVTAGNMITKFTGTRVSKIQLPYNNEAFSLAPYMQKFVELKLLDKCDISSLFYDTDDTTMAYSDDDLTITDGVPKYDYLDVNEVCSDLTKWRIPKLSEESSLNSEDDDKNDKSVFKGEYNNTSWPRDKVYNIGSSQRGFSRYSMAAWFKKGWRKDNEKSLLLSKYANFDLMSMLVINPKEFGFQLYYTGNTFEDINKISTGNWWKGDFAILRIKDNSMKSIMHYCLWSGKEWVSDHNQGTSICDMSGYKEYDTTPIKIYRFSDRAFETCKVYNDIQDMVDKAKKEQEEEEKQNEEKTT